MNLDAISPKSVFDDLPVSLLEDHLCLLLLSVLDHGHNGRQGDNRGWEDSVSDDAVDEGGFSTLELARHHQMEPVFNEFLADFREIIGNFRIAPPGRDPPQMFDIPDELYPDFLIMIQNGRLRQKKTCQVQVPAGYRYDTPPDFQVG